MTPTRAESARPILEQARSEGYKAGYRDGADYWSNYKEAVINEAKWRGWNEAEACAPRRITWWLFGLLCGLAPSVWAFWP